VSNEIGDLKIKVGVEVDASGAVKQQEQAAAKSVSIWEQATEAIRKRNEEAQVAAAVALHDRGMDASMFSDPAAQLKIEETLDAQKAAAGEAAEAHQEAAEDAGDAWSSELGNASKAIGATIAAGAFARELYSSALAIGRQSQQLGVSAQEFQRWGYIAEQAGIESSALAASMAHMQQQAAAAGDMRGASELLGDAADQIQRLGPGTEATALAMQLFGEQGRALLPTLLQGRQGIGRLGDEFDALGGGLDNETIESVAELDRTLSRAKQQLMSLVMPIVQRAVPALQEFAGKIGGVIDKFKSMLSESHLVRAGMITLGALIVGLGVAAAIAWAPFILTLGAILIGAAALGLIVDDVITTFEGGDSIIRRFIDGLFGIGATTQVVQDLNDAWLALTSIFEGASENSDALMLSLGPVGALFLMLKENIGWVVSKLPSLISLLLRLNPLTSAVQGLAAIGAGQRRARAARAPAAAAPAAAPAFNMMTASPMLSAPPTSAGRGGSSRVVHGNQRVNVQVSGMLDAASTRMIGDVVNRAVADANQAAADDLATTGDEDEDD
jgi:hypothetical protein